MASGLMSSSRQLGGCIGLASLTTIATHRTGTDTTRAAINEGYTLGLAIAAVFFLLAAAVAIGMLPRRRTETPAPRPATTAQNRLKGTPS
jgi:hypothetical protein